MSTQSVAVAAVAALGAWLALVVPVFGQEAYYWAYAQHPDLSYFDHPPMVAWLIWLGTHVVGDGAAGLRWGTWLSGCGIAGTGLLLLRRFGVDAAGRAGWLLLCLGVPTLVLTRFLANPDPPLVLFWALCMYCLWRARDGGIRWWLLAGLAAGLALLSKYTAGFLAVSGMILLVLDPPMRSQLRRPGPWLGLLCAALTFLPVIVWNIQHDFESFRFQTGGRWACARLGPRWLLQCAVGQFFVLHPAVCLLLPLALGWLWRRHRDPRALWCVAFGLPLPLALVASSLWIQAKINWFAPACVPLLLGGILWWREAGWFATRPRLLQVVSRSLLVVPLLSLLAPVMRLVPQELARSWNGWEEIAARVRYWEEVIEGTEREAHRFFFFAPTYRDSAQLMRQLSPGLSESAEPDEMFQPILAQNVFGERGLQFEHWAQPACLLGQDAIFVLPRPEQAGDLLERVRPWFASMRRVERVSVSRLGLHIVDADLFLCHDYRPR